MRPSEESDGDIADSSTTGAKDAGPGSTEDATTEDATTAPSGPDGSSTFETGAAPDDAAVDEDAVAEADGQTSDANRPQDSGTDSTSPGSGTDSGPEDANVPDSAEIDAYSAEDASPWYEASAPLDAGSTPDAEALEAAAPCVIPSAAWPAAPPAPPALPPEAAPTVDSLINVTLSVNDLLYDPYSKLLYASVPSSFGANGNSIARIDPTTGTIVGFVYVGSEPGALAESANGQYLYVGINGASAVARYVLASQSPDLTFPLVPPQYSGESIQVQSIQVLPNSPGSALVTSGTAEYIDSTIAVYDNGVPRSAVVYDTGTQAAVVSGSDDLAFEPYGEVDNYLRVLCVDPAGVFIASTVVPDVESENSYPAYAYSAGLFYFPSGEVLDPQSTALAGAYGTEGPFVLEPAVDRVYFLTNGWSADGGAYGAEVIAYDQAHFTPLASAVFNALQQDTNIRLVRWGRYGFAFVSNYGAQISIVRSPIVPAQP
ncbi:MAG: hypothetical protein ACLQVI_00715 [Polyangiaceae bacterium]